MPKNNPYTREGAIIEEKWVARWLMFIPTLFCGFFAFALYFLKGSDSNWLLAMGTASIIFALAAWQMMRSDLVQEMATDEQSGRFTDRASTYGGQIASIAAWIWLTVELGTNGQHIKVAAICNGALFLALMAGILIAKIRNY